VTTPIQPQPSGNDGYGSLSGATLRRDPYRYYSGKDPVTYEAIYTTTTAAHQINTSQANPVIYLPQMNVIPGNSWRFLFYVTFSVPAAAGEVTFQLNAQWYNSAGTMISEDKTPFQTSDEVLFVDPALSYGYHRPVLTAIVPPNASKVHVIARMKCVNPVNAWAISRVSYELLP
jgi:hypothetical protein